MAKARKDLRGRALRKGEMQRSSDKRYVYSYTDPLGRRKYLYANDLVTLRQKEAELTKNQLDGLDIYVAGKATVNFVFDRYMSLKTNLRQTTRSNYLYMYDRFVRDTFGNKKIADITVCWMNRTSRSIRWKAFTRFCIRHFNWRFVMTSSATIQPMVLWQRSRRIPTITPVFDTR